MAAGAAGCFRLPGAPQATHASTCAFRKCLAAIGVLTILCVTPDRRQNPAHGGVKPTRDLRTRLLAASGGMSDAETRELNHLVDLLERCLALNLRQADPPSRRCYTRSSSRAHASGGR